MLHQADQVLQLGGPGHDKVALQLREAGGELATQDVIRGFTQTDELRVDLGVGCGARIQLP